MNPPAPSKGASPLGGHELHKLFLCEKAWQLQHVRKVYVPQYQTPKPLAFGLFTHAARARLLSLAKANGNKLPEFNECKGELRAAIIEQNEANDLPSNPDVEREALVCMEQYIEHWRYRGGQKVVAAEYLIGPAPLAPCSVCNGSFRIPILCSTCGVQELHRTARIDDVSTYSEFGNHLWLGDMKTGSQSIDAIVRTYTMHWQPLLQMALWKTAPQGEAMHGPVRGWMVDVVKKPRAPDTNYKFTRIPIRIEWSTVERFIPAFIKALLRRAQIDWDTETVRNPAACTRPWQDEWGKFHEALCEYAGLCRDGEDGAQPNLYLYGKGLDLRAHEPRTGAYRMPWE